jgi:O-antigen/teichoic acid export membrane protein
MIAEPPTEKKAIPAIGSHDIKRLALHSSQYLAGLAGGLAVGLVSFPIFTRAFPVAEYGLMDLAQRAALVLTIASKAGLQNAVLRFYNKDRFEADRRAARQYYSTMCLGALATSLLMAVCFLGALTLGHRSTPPGPLASLGLLLIALTVLRSVGAILWGFLRIEERTTLFNVSSVATKVATVALICVLLRVTGPTARTYFTGTVAIETVLVVALTAWLASRRLLAIRSFDLKLLRSGIVFGLPLVAYELAFAVLGSADRLLVSHYLGANALGFYSVACGLAQHANDLLVNPLVLAILPIYMNIWNAAGAAKTIEFLTVALDLFLMAAVWVLTVSVVAAKDIVTLLASSKYAGVERLIPVLLAGFLVYATYVFFTAGLMIEKKTIRMAGLLGIAAAANIAFNCLLLPVLGLMGSALATLLSSALCVALLRRASNPFLPLRVNTGHLLNYSAAAIVAGLASSQLQLGFAVGNILGRAAMCLCLYLGLLCFIDGRLRRAGQWTLAEVRSRI